MTNTDSLSLTSLQCTSASFTTCNSNYIIRSSNSYIPTTFFAGTAYYNVANQSLRIYDGLHWYQIILTQVP